jgi:tricorn protease
LSDRDGTFNIYEYVIGTRSLSQLTHHTEFDIKSLSAGGGILVYEIAGNIHTLNPASGEDKELTIMIHGDFPWAMEHWTDVSKNITSASLSPGGARALFEARGDIFTVPAEKGDVRNLSHSPGVADHSPAWSPDGQKIAWFSDKSGEYKLIISDQDGLKPQKEIAIDHPTYFYNLTWSPDSKNLAFTNARRELMILDLEKETIRSVDTDRMAHPERTMIPRWAPDSRWIAYAKQLPNAYHSIMIYSLVDNKSYQITDGLSDAVEPAWDPGKKYLYFLASTDVGLNTGWLDLSSLERPQRRSVYFAVLSKDTISPLLPQSDEEKALAQIKTAEKEKVRAKGKTIPLNKNKEADSVNLRIDFDSIANRILSLPLPPRNYVDLHTGPPDIIYVSEQELPFYPEHPQGPAINVHRWNMGSRKDTLLLKNVSSFNTSSKGSKLIYRQGEIGRASCRERV